MPGELIPFPGTEPARPAGRPRAWLSSEIRGWETVAAALGNPQASAALTRALDAALGELGDATDVAVEGPANKPAISAVFKSRNGARHALEAAVRMRRAVAAAQRPAQPEEQFRIGTGIGAGSVSPATTPEGVPYELLDSEKIAAVKLRDFAGPGQIFLSVTVREAAGDAAQARSLGPVRLDDEGGTVEAFSLIELRR